MLETFEWLHKVLAPLPVVAYPFDLKRLPRNGIYFLYEQGEACGHHGHWPRIVGVGTHKEGNCRRRISEHFLLNERRMNFAVTRPRPHGRSIFRKNIGRPLLNRERDPYLEIWEVDM